MISLSNFFAENKKVAIAFSGGVDSSYLLYAALHYKAQVRAYYVKSAFQPQFELEDAKRLSNELGADLKIIEVDILDFDEIKANPSNRCYFCKRQIFKTIIQSAKNDGYHLVVDGTNASDSEDDRPGIKALKELFVRSPLKECALTKEDIRRLSKKAGLFTWDKASYACLATRIAFGETITKEKLSATENAESALYLQGFRDFRIRNVRDSAKIQLREFDFERLLKNRHIIVEILKKYYKSVTLDLEERK